MLKKCSIIFSQVNIALSKLVTTSSVANATYTKLLNDGNISTAWNTPNSASVYAINELAAGALSAVAAVSSLTILPKNDLVVLGYTSPPILSINNNLIDYNNQPTILNRLAIYWVGHNKKTH